MFNDHDDDDDFLIEDDEEVGSGVKDELFGLKSVSEPVEPAGGLAPAVAATPPRVSTIAAQANPSTPGGSGERARSISGTRQLLPPGTAAPPVIVAPKPLAVPPSPGSGKLVMSPNAQQQSTADVLRGLQEGGQSLLKRLGGLFQNSGSYLPTQNNAFAGANGSQASFDQDSDVFFAETFAKFTESLQHADDTFPVLDDFISDFNAQESLRFDGSDLIEKQERDYFGLREKRMAKLEKMMEEEGKDVATAGEASDAEAAAGIAEQEESRDKAVADGEYQTKVLRDHQSSRGQMFQNIVTAGSKLYTKLVIWPGATDREIALIPECIEEYLIPHIQKKLYCPDRWTDWRFAQLVGSAQFLQPSALEIRTPIDTMLINRCGALLVEVNFLPTPRKKLAAIATACRHIVTYLSEHPMNQPSPRASPTESTSDIPVATIVPAASDPLSPPAPASAPVASTAPSTTPATSLPASAAPDTAAVKNQAHHSRTDEFLAVLIYVLIQTNPPNLLSNVAYLITCRSSSDSMLSDEGYFFAHLAIAVHFLCKLKESKSSSKVDLEGGVILLEPEWLPMVLDKEARLLHLLPALDTARAQHYVIEYKATIRRLAQDIGRKLAKRKNDAAAVQSLLTHYPPISYTSEQTAALKKDPVSFFAEHRYWNSNPEDIKTPAAVAHLLNEYKRLLMAEYRRAVPSDQPK